MTELEYHEEVPYAVMWGDFLAARFSILENAERYAKETVGKVIDTTPKPKIPVDAEFILVETEDVGKDIYQRVEDKHEDAGFYWYRAIDSMAYGHEEMPDMIGDAEVTVLVRLGEAHGGGSRPQEES